MGRGSPALLSTLLKSVSRSFYLTLRVLPVAIRPQIGLAYLLARASDTIADTDAVPKERRLDALKCYRDRICLGKGSLLNLGTLASHQSTASERLLLERVEEAIALLTSFEPPDQDRIREVLGTIISGQALDVERFAEADADHIVALETEEQLSDYIYRVAGCVGEFWTRMCRTHLFPNAHLDDEFLLTNGVRFGKGLQLVNILRDLPADLRLGRCYLPQQRLLEFGLTPSDLAVPANHARLRPLYDAHLSVAEEHLRAGWAYTNYLPCRAFRVRLACAWPILIGVRTIGRLRQANILEPKSRIKIGRKEVRSTLLSSILWYPWPARWRRLFERAQRESSR